MKEWPIWLDEDSAGRAKDGQNNLSSEGANLETWQTLRAGLEKRRQIRAQRQCFRRAPETYLCQLEALVLKSTLPP